MGFDQIANLDIDQTGFGHTLALISGRYKMVILYYLVEFEVVRYNELKRAVKKISHKMLSQTLKELQSDGLIHREEYQQVPPKVEYSLTEMGKSLMPIINSMCYWGDDHLKAQPAKNLV